MNIKNIFKQTTLKSTFIALAITISSTLSYAQQSPNASTAVMSGANKFSERADIIRKFGVTNTINIGWYTGAVQSVEYRDVLARFLPLSNYLSTTFGGTAVLITDKSDVEVTADALKGDIDVIYTSALQATKLLEKGWRPLVGRTDDLKGVILARKEAKITKLEDLAGKKIMANRIATVTQYTKYALHKAQILDKTLFVEQSIGQLDMLNVLKDGAVDAIVVRDNIAEKMVSDNPGKYEIVLRAPASPGHVILISPKINVKDAEVKEAFLRLTPSTKEAKEILAGLDGYREQDLKPFKEITEDNFVISKEVISVVPSLKVKNSF